MKNLIVYFIFSVMLVGCGNKKESTTESYAPTAQNEAKPDEEHPGKLLYKQHCSACHQINGSGVPNMYPPITESEYVNGDIMWLVQSLVKGLEGPITVKGVEYDNLMPAVDYLSDEEMAHILTYIRKNFGNDAGEVTTEQVKKIRTELKEG